MAVVNEGTFVKSTRLARPFSQWARRSIAPAGGSSRSSVSGSRIGTTPVSSSTVATPITFVPDIAA